MKNIPIIWRWWLTVSGIILLFYVGYIFNIKKTMSVFYDYNTQKDLLKKTLISLEKIKHDTIPKTAFPNYFNVTYQDSFFYFFSNYCDSNNVGISEINQFFSQKDSISIETNKMKLNGSYNDLLHLIYRIETERKINPINSVTFELTKDKNNGEFSLSLILYIKRLVYEK